MSIINSGVNLTPPSIRSNAGLNLPTRGKHLERSLAAASERSLDEEDGRFQSPKYERGMSVESTKELLEEERRSNVNEAEIPQLSTKRGAIEINFVPLHRPRSEVEREAGETKRYWQGDASRGKAWGGAPTAAEKRYLNGDPVRGLSFEAVPPSEKRGEKEDVEKRLYGGVPSRKFLHGGVGQANEKRYYNGDPVRGHSFSNDAVGKANEKRYYNGDPVRGHSFSNDAVGKANEKRYYNGDPVRGHSFSNDGVGKANEKRYYNGDPVRGHSFSNDGVGKANEKRYYNGDPVRGHSFSNDAVEKNAK